jgi:hypothetical protein
MYFQAEGIQDHNRKKPKQEWLSPLYTLPTRRGTTAGEVKEAPLTKDRPAVGAGTEESRSTR